MTLKLKGQPLKFYPTRIPVRIEKRTRYPKRRPFGPPDTSEPKAPLHLRDLKRLKRKLELEIDFLKVKRRQLIVNHKRLLTSLTYLLKSKQQLTD